MSYFHICRTTALKVFWTSFMTKLHKKKQSSSYYTRLSLHRCPRKIYTEEEAMSCCWQTCQNVITGNYIWKTTLIHTADVPLTNLVKVFFFQWSHSICCCYIFLTENISRLCRAFIKTNKKSNYNDW